MKNTNGKIMKLAQTALMAALCYVSFTFLQIKIPMRGRSGCNVSSYWECILRIRSSFFLGGWYGGMAGAIGMTIADLMDPIYI